MSRQVAEEAIYLQEELARRQAEDPLRTWTPTFKQTPFIHAVLDSNQYENWFLAANRSGKSDAGSFCGAKLARFGIPGEPFRPTTGWVVSLDFPSSRDILQPKYFDNGVTAGASHAPFIPEREIEEWRISDQILKLKNGSIIGFKSCDSGRVKFQGTEKDWIHFDEEPPKDIYEECIIRIGAGKKLRVLGTCTLLPPEGVAGGVSWLYPEKVQPWMAGRRDWMIYTASIYDNPHLDLGEIRRLESIYTLGSQTARIRLGGELLPGLSGTRAYPAFDQRLHLKSLPALNPRMPLCWFLDFNVEPLCSGVGQRVDGVFRVYKELILEQGSIPEMVELFRTHFPRHGAEVWLYGDASGQRRTAQTAESDYKLILQGMRDYPVPLKLKVPWENPLVRDRLNAMNYALKNEFGQLNLEVDPDWCPELVKDLEQVVMDPRGGIKKVTDKKNPYCRRTHISDALGYWVCYEAPVMAQTRNLSRGGQIRQPGYAFGRQSR